MAAYKISVIPFFNLSVIYVILFTECLDLIYCKSKVFPQIFRINHRIFINDKDKSFSCVSIDLPQNTRKSVLVCLEAAFIFGLELFDDSLLNFVKENVKMGFLEQKLLNVQPDYIVLIQMSSKRFIKACLSSHKKFGRVTPFAVICYKHIGGHGLSETAGAAGAYIF